MVISDRTKGGCSSDLNEPPHPNHDQFAELDAHNSPPGDWQVWLLLAGRGFGKTRHWRNGCANRQDPVRLVELPSSRPPPPMRAMFWWKDKAAFWRSPRLGS